MEEKTVSIRSRRYLGNKYRLGAFIRRVVEEQCGVYHTFADLFAGTGSVAAAFADKKLILNDILYSNTVCHTTWFSSAPASVEKVSGLIAAYNAAEPEEENYMSQQFAGTYFSRQVCRKIGFIREDIERRARAGELTERERAMLITSLLYAMDRIANTCGHYDAWRKGGDLTRELTLCLPEPLGEMNPHNRIWNMDAADLAGRIEADVVYIDPPYNSRQYCDAYHLLENVARWQKPPVSGVAGKMDRTALKSDYCTTRAVEAFEALVKKIRAKYIVLSYNNMGEKGDGRSHAKLPDEEILRILRAKGEVQVFSEQYKPFSAGRSAIGGHAERLFVCRCHPQPPRLVPSPLNYTGGKYRLLPQLLPLFPRRIDRMVDLFCGGCNVGLNAGCSQVTFNDHNGRLLGLLRRLQQGQREEIFEELEGLIDRYGLSRSDIWGYGHYGCDSSRGLGEYNRQPYLALRAAYNRLAPAGDPQADLMLFLLIVYAFNNQIRFNRAGEYNLPVGKRDFNRRIRQKLAAFLDRLQSGDYTFTQYDFRVFPLQGLDAHSLVYADPPYLIGRATYNEQGGWGEQEERDLLALLDELHRRGVPFALSNLLTSRGKQNRLLQQWLERNQGRYRAVPLQYSYANASYHGKARKAAAQEVLIVNYPPEQE